MKLGQNNKQKYALKIYLIMLFPFAFLAVNYLDASHGAVRVPSRAVWLFLALLTLMRTALIRAFSE